MKFPKLTNRWDIPVATATLTSLVAASSFWGANNPGFYQVRRMNQQDVYSKADLRIGGCKGTFEATAVALGASMITRSYWPLVACEAYLALHWGLYSWAFRSMPSDVPLRPFFAPETETSEDYDYAS